MDKLRNIDISNIKAYLLYDNYQLDDGVVYQAAFFNIVILFIGVAYGVATILTLSIASILSIACIIFMIYFKTKVSHIQKQINLYYAIAMIFMSTNLCYNSCVFFSQTDIEFLYPLVIYMLLLPLAAYFMVRSEIKRIINGFHKEKKFENPLIASVAICGAGVGVISFRFIQEQLNGQMFLGICSGILGVIFALFSRFFVKWYCYNLLDNRSAEDNGKTGDG